MRKVLVGVAGSVVLVAGIIAIPLPGPGWLIVFLGLGILASEFMWARRLHSYAKEKYEAWMKWVTKQSLALRALIAVSTALLVIVTLYLLNAYGIINDWLHFHQNWVRSPIVG